MDTIKAIMTRRSIRRFKEWGIEDRKIETLLRAAMQAPSGHNHQPWHFIVITERRILSAIPEFHVYAKMLHQATAAIMVCGDMRIEESIEYINTDCSAATENLLLAAHELGLGAVWLGIYPRERRVQEIRRLLDIPRHIIPIALVALGYAAEDMKPEDRFRPERVHRNRWSGAGS
jgi:nitroreductase